MKAVCAISVLALQVGCTATCVRDSDCIGNSICTDNRCILIVSRGDAGNTTGQGGSSGSATTGGDAGSTQGQGGVGGSTTDPRLNLDAAADAEPESDPR